MRIRGQDGLAERLALLACRREFGRLGRAGQCQAGRDARQIGRREPCLLQTRKRGVTHRRERLFEPQPDIGRSALRFAEPRSRGVAQARPAAGSAAIDAEEQRVRLHHACSNSCPNRRVNA
jgi:hypothetical protein